MQQIARGTRAWGEDLGDLLYLNSSGVPTDPVGATVDILNWSDTLIVTGTVPDLSEAGPGYAFYPGHGWLVPDDLPLGRYYYRWNAATVGGQLTEVVIQSFEVTASRTRTASATVTVTIA